MVLLGHLNVTLYFFEGSVSDLLQQKAGTDARVLYSPLPTVVTPAKSTTLAVEAPTDSTLLEVSANDVTGDSDGRKLIAWVGEESTTLTKLLMTSSGLPVSTITIWIYHCRCFSCL